MSPRRNASGLAALAALAGLSLLSAAPAARASASGVPAAAAAGAAAGERIYRDGILPSGRPLRGSREGGADVEGALAACATCHRRSGLGSWEGRTVIPPIIGRYLFRPGARNVADLDAPHVQGFVPRRDAYTDATLARAIRDGIDAQGRPLGYLMPRYRLDDASLRALVAYLRGLGAAPAPGVTRDTLHFATVITPDADPAARDGMLAVLRQFFADKNAGYRGDAPPLLSGRGVMYRVQRRWQLHVWQLTGPPETWEEQLRARFAAEPVFALVSGIAGRTWAPVHRFCEAEGVPCLFPNVDVPVVAERDFYPVYFSRGVLLEAELLAGQLRGAGRPRGRVVQLFRAGDAGEDGARALAAALGAAGVPVESRAVAGDSPGTALTAGAPAGPDDALVLWLRPPDLRALPGAAPSLHVYVSGLLGGLEAAPLPDAWRRPARLTYPFDLPDARRVRMDFPLAWFHVRHLPVVAERIQTDTYLACAILSETLGHMLDSFVPEYLVERVEVLLSHRLVNGYYPRLGLAPGQRFASKGGYLVRFAADAGSQGTRLAAETPWVTP